MKKITNNFDYFADKCYNAFRKSDFFETKIKIQRNMITKDVRTSGNGQLFSAIATIFKISLVVFALLVIFSGSSPLGIKHAYAANSCTSAQSGNSNVASTWTSCGGTTPQIGDSVTIASGHTVTVVGTFNIANLTVNTGGTFDAGVGTTINITGNLTLASGSTYLKDSGTLNFYGGTTQTVTDNNTTKQDLGNVEVSGYASGSGVSTSPVQQATGSGSTASWTITMSAAPTNGNVMILGVGTGTTGTSITGVSETGVTWHKATSQSSTNANIEIWYGEVGSGAGTVITITQSGTSSYKGNASEWSGLSTTSEFDKSLCQNGSNSSAASPTLTPSQGRNALIYTQTRGGGNATAGPTNSFTALSTLDAGVQQAYLVASSTSGSYSTSYTYSGTSWGSCITSFLSNSVVPSTLDMGSSIKVTTLNVGAGQTFVTGNNTLAVTGSGTGASRPLISTGIFNATGSTVQYTPASTTDVSTVTADNITFNNLSLDPSTSITINLGSSSSQSVTVNGTFTSSSKTALVIPAGVTFTPGANVTVNSTLTINGTYLGGAQSLSVAGDMTVSSGGTCYASKNTTVMGNFTNSGTYHAENAVIDPTATGYSYFRVITIPHSKVSGGADLTNFPLLFSGTYSYLATAANGGAVTNANGYDIIFTSDAAGKNKLSHEIESYNPATGAVSMWVKIPTLSATTDTVIYLWYGNSSITTSQENKTAVWDSNFAAVYHFGDGTTLSAADSTGNNNGTIHGTVIAASGQMGGAANFQSVVGNYISLGSGGITTALNNSAFTISGWMDITAGNQLPFGDAGSTHARQIGYNAWMPNDISVQEENTASDFADTPYSADLGAWHYFTWTYNGGTNNTYIDGVLQKTGSYTFSANYTGTYYFASPGTYAVNGLLDEWRVSNTARSAGWTATEYANQNSPSTFYTVNYGNAYSYIRAITISHTQVGNSDSTNFPVLVSGTYSYLATAANGGKVQNANGYDVGFFADSALTTKLNWETESYNATTGAVVYWVQVPTVSHTSDTQIYMAYGNQYISTDQSNKNFWDSTYGLVMHFGNGSVLSTTDSTSNGNTSTQTGTPTATTGLISGAASFSGTNSITVADNASIRPLAANTFSGWVKPGLTQATFAKSWTKGHDAFITQQIKVSTTDGPEFRAWRAGAVTGNTTQSASISDNKWHYLVGTYDGRYLKAYVDGVLTSTYDFGSTANLASETNGLELAAYNEGSPYTGLIDEFRVANVARSADWVTAEYNNQASPSNFYSVGSEFENSNANSNLYLTPTNSSVAIGGTTKTDLDNFTITASAGAGKTVTFAHAVTYTFHGSFNVAGQSSNYLSIASDLSANKWFAHFASTAFANNVYIKDSGCDAGSYNVLYSSSMFNSGNNGTCWFAVTLGGATPVASGGGTPTTGGTPAGNTTPTGQGSGGGTPTTGGTSKSGSTTPAP